MPRLAPDTAMLPRDDEVFPSPTLESGPLPQHADGRIFADTVTPGFLPRGLFTANTYPQPLSFAEPDVPKDILLPEISQYVPPNHDTDAANALAALYRSHCISLVDCIRYCKQKQFFRLFTSFSGTLTVPVQKLFVNPALADWIKESDWIMYQNMLQSMYNLTLDVLPMPVTRMLDTISKQLRNHITRTFQGHPHHVLEAKLEPATLFSELVARLLKVNSTAHAAAVVLQQQECRETMWRGWVETVNPKKLMESELPGCGQEETYNILTRELLPLLRPVVFMDQYTSGTHYRDSLGAKLAEDASESYIDRIGQFVQSIPARFPNAKPRTVVDCVKNLGSAAMRDLTIEQSTSFNGWWLVKIFIDEMIQWLASSRGFMAHRPAHRENQVLRSASVFANGVHEGSVSVGGGSEHQSRYSSMGADFAADALVGYQTTVIQSSAPQHSQSKSSTYNIASPHFE
jgi:regulatory factor X